LRAARVRKPGREQMSATVAKDMPGSAALLAAIALSGVLCCGCGGGSATTGGGSNTGGGGSASSPAGVPIITTVATQNGAVIVTLTSPTPGATILYSVDGTTPNAASSSTMIYQAPLLVASNLTVTAVATSTGHTSSAPLIQTFTPNIPSGTLVWSDEFSNSTSANAAPNSQFWTYDTGNSGFGNQELENYCAWGSNAAPCDPTKPNAYADPSGILHIVARKSSTGVFTSARLKTQGLFSFQYGRIETRMMLPESQGMWPAFWLLGNSITTIDWPACGELDVMEHIDGSNPQNEGFDWVQGSIHGSNLNGGIQYHPVAFTAAAWHTYGMIWSKGQIQYYVDSPSNIYATFTSSTQAGTWPFDSGSEFILLNLASGGSWPGSPNATTVFPSEIQVDYVRVYTN
jgi:beta-glucanase (GH16 family)